MLLIDFVQNILKIDAMDSNLAQSEYDKVFMLSLQLIQNAMRKRTSDVWCCFLNFSSWRPSGMWRLKSHVSMKAYQWSLLMIWGRIAFLCIYVQLSLSISELYGAIIFCNQHFYSNASWIIKISVLNHRMELQRLSLITSEKGTAWNLNINLSHASMLAVRRSQFIFI